MSNFNLSDVYGVEGGGLLEDANNWARDNSSLLLGLCVAMVIVLIGSFALGFILIAKQERLSSPTMTRGAQQQEWGLGGAGSEHAGTPRDASLIAQGAADGAIFKQKNMSSAYVLAAPEFDCKHLNANTGTAWDWMNAEVHVEGAAVPKNSDSALSAALAGR